MAKVIITMKIMPEGVDVDLDSLQGQALEKIKNFAGDVETKTSQEPVAFGLKSINIIFVMDEAKGSTEALENDIASIEGINSAEIIDVRRAIG